MTLSNCDHGDLVQVDRAIQEIMKRDKALEDQESYLSNPLGQRAGLAL